MQRFRLMNVYILAVLFLIGLIILTESSHKPGAAAAPVRKADLPADGVAIKPLAGLAPRQSTDAKRVTVSIENFKFAPRELSLAVGSTVIWVNHDDVPHTATSSDDPATFKSKTLDTEDTYSFTFTKPGTYSYFCKVHPDMTGVIVVK